MQNDDATIKTSIRILRSLHRDLERAASSSGISLNAEMIVRLERDPRDDAAREILEEIRRRDDAIADGLRKQIGALWGALKRADDVLGDVAKALARAPADGDAAMLRKDVEFARQLIGAIGAHHG